jgi:hypothetical protein
LLCAPKSAVEIRVPEMRGEGIESRGH